MHLTKSLLTLALMTPVALSAATTGDTSALHRRVVEHATERAQQELVRATSLWVDHSSWDNPWIVESEHYQVRTTHSRFLAAFFAKSLEAMYAEYVKLLGSSGVPPRKFRIWIFPDLPSYNTFGNDRGAEHSSMYGSFYAAEDPEKPVATCFTKNYTQLGMWITHSAAHQFVEQMFPGELPLWIAEGIASYFALHWDWPYGVRELRRLVPTPAYVPLERLTREPIAAYVRDADMRFLELGMLFHYLLNYRADTKTVVTDTGETGEFREFLRTLVRGGRQEAANSPFGRLISEEPARIEQEFKSFDFGGP